MSSSSPSASPSATDSNLLTEITTDLNAGLTAGLSAEFNARFRKDDFDIADFDITQGAVADILHSFSDVVMTDEKVLDADDLKALTSLKTTLVTVAKHQPFQPAYRSPIARPSAPSFISSPSILNRLLDLPITLPDNAAAFTTIDNSGKQIDNGQGANVNEQRKWTRSDGKADGRGATVVTFAFDDSFSVGGLSTERAKSLFVTALQTWANYSPLEFVELADPGSGDRVDIFTQSSAIDGQGKTLAFTYFPSIGDITFDTGEAWSENIFLETAVHELGHALGLDHEDDTQAIMNSILRNRYTNGGTFLLEDDINGIRSLYGSGKGSITALNTQPTKVVTPPTATAPVTNTNLIVNGSFEEVPLSVGEYGMYSSIKGWSAIDSSAFLVDRRPAIAGQAADGTAWVELDVKGVNNTIGQNIDTLTGQTYKVSVDFSNGGRAESSTLIEVFWEGKKVDTLSGGGKGQWRRFNYQMRGSDRGVSTLAFRAVGSNDSVGGYIDNIVVTGARRDAIAPPSSQGSSSEPTSHRDLISGEPQALLATGLTASYVPTEFI
jgi:hypothetical protein